MEDELEHSNACTGQVDCTFICGEPGLCEGGDAVFSDSATTATACQDACTKYSGCNYYSYTPTTDECLMFDTCPTLDTEACPECVSGNPGCAVEDIEKGEGHHE